MDRRPLRSTQRRPRLPPPAQMDAARLPPPQQLDAAWRMQRVVVAACAACGG